MFCTISTCSHLFKTFALAESLQPFFMQLSILLVDDDSTNKLEKFPSNAAVYNLADLPTERVQQVVKKYRGDRLRWALKPIFLLFLLQKKSKVIYVDNDIAFFNSPTFLFDELEKNNV